VSSASASTAYEVAVTMTLRETGGGSGRVTRLRSVVTRSVGAETAGTLDTDLPFAALASVTQAFTQQFDLTSAATVALRVTASGVDSLGRTFETSSVSVSVEPPYTPPPTVPTGGSTRIDLHGGSGYRDFIGCFTCGQFDADSVHNQFGRYGSQFSSTSIWNQFSDYGSRFSTNGACNEFASNPPAFVQGGRIVGELTLNTFRSLAIRDSTVQTWLRVQVCKR